MKKITDKEIESILKQLDFRWKCYTNALSRLTDQEREAWLSEMEPNPMDANDGEYRVYRVNSEWEHYQGMINALVWLGFEWKRTDGEHWIY